MVIEKNWVNRKNLGYFIFFHMKSPSYESKYIPPPEKKTPFWHQQILEVESFFPKKKLIFWLEVHLPFFTSATYTYIHTYIYLYTYIYVDFFGASTDVFFGNKNTHISMGIRIPEFFGWNGGWTDAPSRLVGNKVDLADKDPSSRQVGSHEKTPQIAKGGEPKRMWPTIYVSKHTSPMKSYGYMYVCMYVCIYTRWWQLKYFVMFNPYLGEMIPILTSIFFRWVETTN